MPCCDQACSRFDMAGQLDGQDSQANLEGRLPVCGFCFACGRKSWVGSGWVSMGHVRFLGKGIRSLTYGVRRSLLLFIIIIILLLLCPRRDMKRVCIARLSGQSGLAFGIDEGLH